MNKDKLREFILAMKKNNYKQALGNLFVLDTETDEVYACALGQGVMNFNGLSTEDIRAEIHKDDLAMTEPFPMYILKNGTKVIRGRCVNSEELEDKWNHWLNNLFSDEFLEFVTTRNDGERLTVQDIAGRAMERFIGEENA